MGMKQGGTTRHNTHKSKRGIESSFVCAICGRRYKQLHTKDTHENKCRQYNKK